MREKLEEYQEYKDTESAISEGKDTGSKFLYPNNMDDRIVVHKPEIEE